MSGGVDVVGSDGTPIDFLETGGVPLNCVFHQGSLFITDFGDVTEVSGAAPMEGRLWKVEVGVDGMPLFRGAIV
jgi:gluconolactonase